MHLGWASVELNIARILWAFDVEPVKSKDGKDIDVDMSVSHGDRPHVADPRSYQVLC